MRLKNATSSYLKLVNKKELGEKNHVEKVRCMESFFLKADKECVDLSSI